MTLVRLAGDDAEREFAAVYYCGGALPPLPWAGAQFDAAIIADCEFPSNILAQLTRELVQQNVDWVATVGRAAEALHDAIDDASVLIGRQRAVGDGNPMTSWHDDAVDSPRYAQVATSLLGGNDHVLVIFVGERIAFEAMLREIGRCLISR